MKAVRKATILGFTVAGVMVTLAGTAGAQGSAYNDTDSLLLNPAGGQRTLLMPQSSADGSLTIPAGPNKAPAIANPTDKARAVVNELLTVQGNLKLEPSGHSVVDVQDRNSPNRDKGAYLNLKLDW